MKKSITTLTELKRSLSDGDIIYLDLTKKPDFNGWWISFNDFIINIDDKIKQKEKAEIIMTPQNTYIDATHFGSTKLYTWRVPQHLIGKVHEGKIVKVKTKNGDQFVKIIRVYKEDAKPSIHRCVVDVLEV